MMENPTKYLPNPVISYESEISEKKRIHLDYASCIRSLLHQNQKKSGFAGDISTGGGMFKFLSTHCAHFAFSFGFFQILKDIKADM